MTKAQEFNYLLAEISRLFDLAVSADEDAIRSLTCMTLLGTK